MTQYEGPRANPAGANLAGAHPTGANPISANPTGANLTGVNPDPPDPDHDKPDRPVAARRHAFSSPSPRHTPIPAAPSASAAHIPDKLYFRIGEVARLCDVQAYVLRFWETEFPQLRPNKGGTGQRLFRRRDVEMALRIRHLLYDEGYTIPGARQLLKAEARPRETQLTLVEDTATQQLRRNRLRALYRSLSDLHALLSAGPSPLADTPTSTAPPTGLRRSSSPKRGQPELSASLFADLYPEASAPPPTLTTPTPSDEPY